MCFCCVCFVCVCVHEYLYAFALQGRVDYFIQWNSSRRLLLTASAVDSFIDSIASHKDVAIQVCPLPPPCVMCVHFCGVYVPLHVAGFLLVFPVRTHSSLERDDAAFAFVPHYMSVFLFSSVCLILCGHCCCCRSAALSEVSLRTKGGLTTTWRGTRVKHAVTCHNSWNRDAVGWREASLLEPSQKQICCPLCWVRGAPHSFYVVRASWGVHGGHVIHVLLCVLPHMGCCFLV